jgi:hypothetical protein
MDASPTPTSPAELFSRFLDPASQRQSLKELVPFGKPLALIEQDRAAFAGQ